MNSLITGASGFIGHNLLSHIKSTRPSEKVSTVGLTGDDNPKANHFICDLTKEDEIRRVIDAVKPDRIYHLAGGAKVSESIGMPEYFQSNFLTTVGLLEALKKRGAPTSVFFASSVHVYGNQLNEVDESASPCPEGLYGFSKYLAEEAFRHYTQIMPGLNVVVGRLYSCIGPGQAPGFVASDLCQKILALPATPNAVLKTGPLTGIRRFLDVRDAVRIFPVILDKVQPSRFEVYNIASPYELQIRQMVDMLLDIAGKSPKVEAREQDNPFKGLKLSIGKLNKALPDHHFRPIEETLRDMLMAAAEKA